MDLAGLPVGWVTQTSSRTGETYFFNTMTGESSWFPPRYCDPPIQIGANREIRCSHILVKHEGSRKPFDRNKKPLKRTAEEALKLCFEYRGSLIAGTRTFYDLAREVSDCSSFMIGGDLGVFGRQAMTPEFEAAAFELELGELSAPVSSSSGMHLILRTM